MTDAEGEPMGLLIQVAGGYSRLDEERMSEETYDKSRLLCEERLARVRQHELVCLRGRRVVWMETEERVESRVVRRRREW